MNVIYNDNFVYDPRTGTLWEIKNNVLVAKPILFTDSETAMEKKQHPTDVAPGYVNLLKGYFDIEVAKLTAFIGRAYKITLSTVKNDGAFGLWKIAVENQNGPTVDFSLKDLAYAFMEDPINKTNFISKIRDGFSVKGYVLQ